jgi:hypothetical protein
MSKPKNKTKKLNMSVEKTIAVESTMSMAGTKMTLASRYKMIPVDQQTYLRLLALCKAHGFGQRGQGAMVRKLVNVEFEKIPSSSHISAL